MWRFFSAVAGFLEWLVLRPDAGALQSVDGGVAILLNDLCEFFACPRRPGRQHAEIRQAAQQDRQEGVDMAVGMPGAEAEMEARHVKGGVCLQVIQNEEQLPFRSAEVAFRPA